MSLWHTEAIMKALKDSLPDDVVIKFEMAAGDHDTETVSIKRKEWGDDGLRIRCFNDERPLSNIEREYVEIDLCEVMNLRGKSNLYKNANLAGAHALVCILLTGLGFTIVDDMENFF